MSREDLLEVAQVQQQQLHTIYSTIALPNQVLSPMGKLVHIAGRVVMSNQKPNDRGQVRFDMESAAALIGMSPSAVARTVRNDCKRFQATYEVQTYITKKGQKCNLSFVDPDEPYWKAPQVVDLPPEQLRNLPGDTRRCASCEGTMRKRTRVLVSQETWICQECGEQTVYAPVVENLPLDVTMPEEEKGLQVVEPFLDPKSELEKASQSDAIPTYTGGGIPAELKAFAHWLPWRYDKEKVHKVPHDARKRVNYTNPKYWMTYEQASALCQAGQFDGIGYVFSHDDLFTGIDLDHCRDKETGALSDQAHDLNRLLRTYGEISPSGTGIKWIARGQVEHSGKEGDFEMYDHKRFFAITGQALPDAPATIEYRQAQLTRLNAPMAAKHAAAVQKPLAPPCVSASCGLPEHIIIEKCRNGQNGARFERLWAGDMSGYNSPSEADLALCNELAYRSDNDATMIDHLFRQSGLYRPEKWDRNARSGETYGQGTIRLAMRVRGILGITKEDCTG